MTASLIIPEDRFLAVKLTDQKVEGGFRTSVNLLQNRQNKTVLFIGTYLASENHSKVKERTDYHKSLDSDSSI